MAIRDLQQRLATEEANSGKALFTKLVKELDKVYVSPRGWRTYIGFNTEGTKGNWATYDSYWEQAYKEIRDGAKAAVMSSKSAKAKEVLGDLQSLVKDIAGTTGITAPIGEAVQRLVSVVQPYIEERVVALKKGEGVIKTMKKNAVASATSAVEGFASSVLSPLPFGAGDAILGKAKGLLGSNKERRSAQAMGFISRVNEDVAEKKEAEERETEEKKGEGKKSGGIVKQMKKSNVEAEEQGGEVVELLTNIEKNTQYMADNMEDAESRRERLRKQGMLASSAKNAGAGAGAGAGVDDEEGGFWSNLLGSFLGAGGGTGLGGFSRGGKGVRGGGFGRKPSAIPKGGGKMPKVPQITSKFLNLDKFVPKGVLARASLIPILAGLGPLLLNPYVIGAVALGGLAYWLMGSDFVKGGDPLSEMSPEQIEEKMKRDAKALEESQKVTKAFASKYGQKVEGQREGEDVYQANMRMLREKEEAAKKIPSRKTGGPIKQTGLYNLHKGEMVLDEKLVDGMVKGMGFNSLAEFSAAGKSSAGYSALMDRFSPGMLASKHGGMLENAAMMFGLAGHGQLGKTKFRGSTIDKYSMGAETVMKLFEKLNYFKGRERGEAGSKRRKNMDRLNAMRAFEEITRSMAIIGDSPEEQAAIKRRENMTMREQILDDMSLEEANRIGLELKESLGQRFEAYRKNELGRSLNQSAMLRDRFTNRGGAVGQTPTMIDQSVTNLSNTTITPMITRGQMLPGESSSIRPRAK